MKNFKLTLSYKGDAYFGWQKTPLGASIESLLEEALMTLLRHPVKLQAASRTDRGVHARAQVVNFLTPQQIPPAQIQYRLNGLLPRDIAITSISEMPLNFHPTLDNKGKEYLYYICSGTSQNPFYRTSSWHFSYPLNRTLMEKGAELLTGSHDFSAFCNERKLWDRNPYCHLQKITITPLEESRFCFSFEGDHFLYRMARNLAGTLAYLGAGKLPLEKIPLLLANKERKQAGITAPAHALILNQVYYEYAQ